MRLYLRKKDQLFPCYQAEVDDSPVDENGVDLYIEVVGIEADCDPKTQRLSNWTVPDIAEGEAITETDDQGIEIIVGHKAGVMTAYRYAVDRPETEIAARMQEGWADVRMARDKVFAETDALILRALEDLLPAGEYQQLRDYRQALRDIEDPTKNGGITDPGLIKIEKFSDA